MGCLGTGKNVTVDLLSSVRITTAVTPKHASSTAMQRVAPGPAVISGSV